MSTLTLGDLKKTVPLEDVERVLMRHLRDGGSGRHEIDLGDFGYETIDCDAEELSEEDVHEILKELESCSTSS